MQSYLYPDAVISVTQRSLHMNKFYVIIYHPSRFICITHLNILIYRHLNSVIDTSKTEISITLSITNSLHLSRFSAYLLAKSKKIFAEYGYGTWRKRTTRCAALAHGYYCIGVRILLRRVTDITASGYRYYCVGVRILLRRLAQTYP